MNPAKLAELAAAVFGPDRVRQAGRLDNAIQIAVGLADDAAAAAEMAGALPGGSGILVTGSVITAGDARLLLAPQDVAAGRESGSDTVPGPVQASRADPASGADPASRADPA
jgi:hypothetical protein